MISTGFEIVFFLQANMSFPGNVLINNNTERISFRILDLLDRSIFHDKRNINFLMPGMKNHKFRFSQI